MKGVFNASVFMGRPLYPADITTVVSVYNAETDALVPTLWLDRDGIEELANPHPLSEDGVILFYVDPGRYNIVVEKGTMLYREWPDVIISDSATRGEGGATDFTDLGDVPSSYAGQAGKAFRVNSSATGLEFYASADAGVVAKIDAEIEQRESLIRSAHLQVGGEELAFAMVDDDGSVVYGISASSDFLVWATMVFPPSGMSIGGTPEGLVFSNEGEEVLTILSDSSVRLPYAQQSQLTDHRYSAAWADSDGAVALWINHQGEVGFIPAPGSLDGYLDNYISTSDAFAEAIGNALYEQREIFVADICHILVSGQSLSVGVAATPGLTVSQPYSNLMPSGGVIDGTVNSQGPTSSPVSTSFVPLMFVSQNAGLGETVGIGGANFVTKLVNDSVPSLSFQVLVSNNGYGGRAIEELSKGGSGPYYQYGIEQCSLYRSRANSLGKTYVLQAVWWLQGETDSTNNLPREDYKDALIALIENMNSDLPQKAVAPLLTYQMASHTKRGTGRPPEIALAQLDASREHRDIYLVSPTYHLDYVADGVHLTNHSTRWLGQYFAKVHKRVCIDNEEWRPLEPTAVIQQGQLIHIDFHVPHGPLVLDVVRVTDPGDFGFEVLDEVGNVLDISSISLVGSSGVRIVLDDEPEAAVRVRYAYGADGWQTGPSSGARGCLRDSDPTVGMYNDGSGDPYELYNWCVIFNEQAEVI